MTPHAHARTGYTRAAAPIRNERDTEYAVFAQVTHRLKAADPKDPARFAELCTAVTDNQRLWMTLADDLMLDTNPLPVQLRGQLVSLAIFVQKHSLKVMARSAGPDALIDINTAVMKGLRGTTEASA